MRDDEHLGARLEDRLRPFVQDPLLWPVLAVAVGMLATDAAALLVLACRDRSPAALAAVALLAALGARGTVTAARRRRLGAAGGVAVAIALLAAAEAALYMALAEH